MPSSHFLPWLNSDFPIHISFSLSHENIAMVSMGRIICQFLSPPVRAFLPWGPDPDPKYWHCLRNNSMYHVEQKTNRKRFALLFCFGKHISISNLLWRNSKVGMVSISFSEFYYCYKFKTILWATIFIKYTPIVETKFGKWTCI